MRSRHSDTFGERFNVWPGFTDVMVGLLLIFIFVVTLFTITQTILSRSMSEKDVELERLQKELSTKSEELDQLSLAIANLENLFQQESQKGLSLSSELTDKMKELEAALADVGSLKDELAEKQQAILAQRADIEASSEKIRALIAESTQKEEKIESQAHEISSSLSKLNELNSLLGRREQRIAELGVELKTKDEEVSKSRAEAIEGSKRLTELHTKLDNLNRQIAALNKRIADYAMEIQKLNQLVAESKTSESLQKTKAASLQQEITGLRSKLDELSTKLAGAQTETKEKFRLSQLVSLLGERDKEIDHLRKLAKYRSEFLAKLEELFAGVEDIQVHGDRFVFQSEILFGSGRTEINESGKKELDKLVAIYKEMVPKIPPDVDLIIMVHGYTDTDPVKVGRFKSNWELSAARAMEVVRYLIDKGIPENRVGASALGEFHPVKKEATPEAKRLNRRIEIKITSL